MIKNFISFFKKEKEEPLQEVENEILNNILLKLKKVDNTISEIVRINIEESQTKDPSTLLDYRTKEVSRVLDVLDILEDIYIDAKMYLEEYIKEINSDDYLSPEKKYMIISTIKNRLKNIKQKLDRLFVEMEILLQRI